MTEVSAFLQVEADKIIKSLVFKVDDELVMILVRGDHEVNDIKVKNVLGATSVELAEHEETANILRCEIGSLGPVNVPASIKIYADHAIETMMNAVCGANEDGNHLINVVRDVISK
ncbi:YbaK/EbsC family protein [Bacillus sp. N9]